MATPRKPKEEHLPEGRPSEYKPEYCQMLIEHYKQGGVFEAFGAIANVSKQTLYNWTKAYPEFFDAKKVGEAHSLKFWTELGKMIASGQLRRIKKQTPILDKEGKPQYDNNGKLLVEIEYESTTAGQSTWIFMMKNMHRWRDSIDLNHGGQGDDADPVKFDFSGKSIDDLEKRMTELMLKAQKKK